MADRYPSDPGDPMKALEERLRLLEAKVEEQNRRNPLNNGVFSGTLRNVDADGDTLVTIGPDGMSIPYGAIEVGGGPVRAIDLDFQEGQSLNVSLTTTMQVGGSATITPPAWADTVVAQAFCLFQMTNSSGGAQSIQYRATVNGIPSSGAFTHTVGAGEVANVTDLFMATLERGTDFTTTFDVAGVMGVDAGTNGANVIRTKATLFFLR